ncbi:hypothetical protein ABKV19_017298 [Rosa sericea]
MLSKCDLDDYLALHYFFTHTHLHLALPLFGFCLSYGFVTVSRRQRNKVRFKGCELVVSSAAEDTKYLALPLFFCLSYEFVSLSGRQRDKLSVEGCQNSGFLSRRRYKPLQITYSYWDGAGIGGL